MSHQVRTPASSIDVSERIRCIGAFGTATAIGWSTTDNKYWSPGAWAVKLDSTGKKYLIEAKCQSIGGMTADASTLELDASGASS